MPKNNSQRSRNYAARQKKFTANRGKNSAMLDMVKRIEQSEIQNHFSPDRMDVEWPLLPSRETINVISSFYPSTGNGGAQPIGIASAETPFAYSIALSYFADVASYQAVFDCFRIRMCRFDFVNSAAGGANLITAVDTDDANTPTAATLIQYDTHLISGPGEKCRRVFVPRAADAVYQGAFTAFGQTDPLAWMDIGNPGVLYYGLKAVVSSAATTSAWNLCVTCWLQFTRTR